MLLSRRLLAALLALMLAAGMLAGQAGAAPAGADTPCAACESGDSGCDDGGKSVCMVACAATCSVPTAVTAQRNAPDVSGRTQVTPFLARVAAPPSLAPDGAPPKASIA